jgi:hypothetical protein
LPLNAVFDGRIRGRLLIGTATLIAMTIAGGPLQTWPCEPAKCLEIISTKLPVTPLAIPESALVGKWSRGSGLSGSHLYLFHDRTYIHTEWTDLKPETIYDKGSWALADGLLAFKPDAAVVWRFEGDRRFVGIQGPETTKHLLMGLDWSLWAFVLIVEKEPRGAAGFLRAISLTKRQNWTRGAGPGIKAGLIKRCWRPQHFAE